MIDKKRARKNIKRGKVMTKNLGNLLGAAGSRSSSRPGPLAKKK